MTGRPDIATSLADAARTMDAAPSLDDALDAIARAARVSLPRFEHVGIATIESAAGSPPGPPLATS